MTNYLLLAERCLLALIFGFAAVAKSRAVNRLQQFGESIERMTGFGEMASVVLAAGVVLAEAAVAIGLMTPLFRWGFAASTVLLLVFTGMAVSAVRRGVLAECRCFGGKGGLLGTATILRNLLLLIFAVSGFLLETVTGEMSVTGVVAALLTGGVIALFFIRYYDLVVRHLGTRAARSDPVTEGR